MKKIFFFYFLFSCFLAEDYVEKIDKNGKKYLSIPEDPIQTRIYTLENGLKVFLSPNNLNPLVSTNIIVRAGSSFDPDENTGLAHYLEHMLFKGTSKIGALDFQKEKPLLDSIEQLYEKHKKTKKPAEKTKIYKQIDLLSQKAALYVAPNELDQIFKSMGNQKTNAFTSNEETVYLNEVPSHRLEDFLQVESERFSQLVLRLFHTEMEAVYEEFNMSQDNNDVIDEALSLLFPTHPYGTHTTIGKGEHLQNPSWLAIKNYHQKYYIPNNMAIALSGDLDPEQTFLWIEKYFGHFEKKPLEPLVFLDKKPLQKPIEKTIFKNGEVYTLLSYVLPKNPENIRFSSFFNQLINNSASPVQMEGVAGQKIQSCFGYVYILREYMIHFIWIKSRPEQTNQQAKAWVLEAIEKIAKGAWEEKLLEGIAQEQKINFDQSLSSNAFRLDLYRDAFIRDIDLAKNLKENKQKLSFSKTDLTSFIEKNYKQPQLVIYKEDGKNPNAYRVQPPKITPIVFNQKAHSTFFEDFFKRKIPEPKAPHFFDPAVLKIQKTKYNRELIFVADTNSFLKDLFELRYVFDFGKKDDPQMAVAMDYIQLLGTLEKNQEQIKKELFYLGVRLNFFVSQDQFEIVLDGIQKNLPQALSIVKNYFQNLKADELIYEKFVADEIQKRVDFTKDPENLLFALKNWVLYGEKSPSKRVFSNAQLQNQKGADQVRYFQQLFDYPYQMVYKAAKMEPILLADTYALGAKKTKKPPFFEIPAPSPAQGKKYATAFAQIQNSLLLLQPQGIFDPKNLAFVQMFNNYFGRGLSSIVFQEIREAGGLVYRAYSDYQLADQKGKHDIAQTFLLIQSEKIPQAEAKMDELFQNLPQKIDQFEQARANILNRIQMYVSSPASFFDRFQQMKKLEMKEDPRKIIYEQVSKMTWESFETWFKTHFQNQKKDQLRVGEEPKEAEIEKIPAEILFGF